MENFNKIDSDRHHNDDYETDSSHLASSPSANVPQSESNDNTIEDSPITSSDNSETDNDEEYHPQPWPVMPDEYQIEFNLVFPEAIMNAFEAMYIIDSGLSSDSSSSDLDTCSSARDSGNIASGDENIPISDNTDDLVSNEEQYLNGELNSETDDDSPRINDSIDKLHFDDFIVTDDEGEDNSIDAVDGTASEYNDQSGDDSYIGSESSDSSSDASDNNGNGDMNVNDNMMNNANNNDDDVIVISDDSEVEWALDQPIVMPIVNEPNEDSDTDILSFDTDESNESENEIDPEWIEAPHQWVTSMPQRRIPPLLAERIVDLLDDGIDLRSRYALQIGDDRFRVVLCPNGNVFIEPFLN